MKTIFADVKENDIFVNDENQVCQKGYGIFWNTGKILFCSEGSVGRYYVNPNDEVTVLTDIEWQAEYS